MTDQEPFKNQSDEQAFAKRMVEDVALGDF